jgi:peptidoglycan/LPS O-acetylase OafA/YrhL
VINDYLNYRKSNLDVLRFLLAILVVLFHSYPLTGVNYNGDSLRVYSFFVISGFFVTLSYNKHHNVISFLKARIYRIYPALIVTIIFTTFILGPIATRFSLHDYFTNIQTYKYLTTMFILPDLQYNLPGVFTNNPFKNSVNGALWTLKPEIIFYLFVTFLGITKLLKKSILIYLLCIMLLVTLFPWSTDRILELEVFKCFLAGMLLYVFRRNIPLNKYYALGSLILLLIGTLLGHLPLFFVLFGSYFIIYIVLVPNIRIPFSKNLSNYSYGIYLYAFPIQQWVVSIYKGKIVPLEDFIIAFPIALIFAILSWHLIEKKFQLLKHTSINPLAYFKIINKNRRYPL